MNNVESLMENGMLIVRQRRSQDHCWRWLSIFSFLFLVGATIIFALLHFQIIPNSTKKDEYKLPEILAIKTYLDSVPREFKAQAQQGQKVAAHFTGRQEGGKLLWENSDLNAIMDEEMSPKDNSLVIPREGLYFVYTNVAFTGPNCKHGKALQLSHTVNRMSDSIGDTIPILTSTKSVCEARSDSTWFQPIYQGGLFHLEKGDVLSTETTHVDFLDIGEGQIYFGILSI
ncbi:tumor necrosis factor-like [Rhinophrynus dorsalis]